MMSKLIVLGLLLLTLVGSQPVAAAPTWTSPNHYRVLLTANAGSPSRHNSPASVDVDLQSALLSSGGTGQFDEYTIEVIGYDALGAPRVFDSSRSGYEQYLLPWRIQKYYGINTVTLSFVMPDQLCTQYAVYFDTKQSGLGKPQRYAGLVGDGDRFKEGYQRREINASHFDAFCDLDNDGDLDLFKGGTEPYIYCYENVGGGKLVDRGLMTNGGQLWTLTSDVGRAWVTLAFDDWDGDGDQDLFASYSDGPQKYNIVRYENATLPGGSPTFIDRGVLFTESGQSLGSDFFSAITIVDWNGDGRKEVLIAKDGCLRLHQNISPNNSLLDIRLTDGEYVNANGLPIRLGTARFDFADIDSDGDLDMFAGTQKGDIYMFTNVGTRSNPAYGMGRVIAFYEFLDSHSGVKVADFDGDGLLDFVAGRFWERTHWGEQPRMYGRIYKNVGTPTQPRFEARDANSGSPYTEQFQICDAVRQNGARAVDWNGDGKTDLIASDTDGFTWLFRNTTNNLFPVFATGEKLMAGGNYARVYGASWAGYARSDVADWDNDGDLDLFVCDIFSRLFIFKNIGSAANPVLAAAVPVYANGVPLDGNTRGTPLVCDWNNDGKKDIFIGEDVGASSGGFMFYRNTGTDAAPVLAAGVQILPGGDGLHYPRPNMGSFLDWDGDGKKDLIAGEFENAVHFYKNIGSGAVGAEPVFADSGGQVLINAFSMQLVSGADAKDWNGDTDVDIITGQGHGGGGIRFYDRNFIDDSLNGTSPVVTVGQSQHDISLVDAKGLADGAPVTITRATISASFADFVYVQSEGVPGGIRVMYPGAGFSAGNAVDVSGNMGINDDGERCIKSPTVTRNGSGTVYEYAVNHLAFGGVELRYSAAGVQMGVAGGVGLNNIGMLVRVHGKCALNLAAAGDYYGQRYLFIDDGSGVNSWYRDSGGEYRQVSGVKVDAYDPAVIEGDSITARGISSIELVNNVHQRRLLPRPGMGDLTRF